MIQCKNINQAQIYPIINTAIAMLELFLGPICKFPYLLYSKWNVELVREKKIHSYLNKNYKIPKLLTWILKLIALFVNCFCCLLSVPFEGRLMIFLRMLDAKAL